MLVWQSRERHQAMREDLAECWALLAIREAAAALSSDDEPCPPSSEESAPPRWTS
jgi:hypothetical protein